MERASLKGVPPLSEQGTTERALDGSLRSLRFRRLSCIPGSRSAIAMWNRALFRDRRDAGRRLAEQLRRYKSDDVIVIGLPRGGVEVAFEIAIELDAPLDVVVSRKLGAPSQPELGIGAVAQNGIMLLDEPLVRSLGISEKEIHEIAERERLEMQRRLREYRGRDELPQMRGKTVIMVDDGLATGVTSRAAVLAARKENPKRIVLAVPVCADETAAAFADDVEELVCLHTPERFVAVGFWYQNFSQTTDAQVIELLEEARGQVSREELKEL